MTRDIVGQVPEISEFEVRAEVQRSSCFIEWGVLSTLTEPPRDDVLNPATGAQHVCQVGLANLFILHTSASLTINENGEDVKSKGWTRA